MIQRKITLDFFQTRVMPLQDVIFKRLAWHILDKMHIKVTLGDLIHHQKLANQKMQQEVNKIYDSKKV